MDRVSVPNEWSFGTVSSTPLLFGQYLADYPKNMLIVDTGAMRFIITEATPHIGSKMFHVNENLYTVDL